jgi:hypothetical protein
MGDGLLYHQARSLLTIHISPESLRDTDLDLKYGVVNRDDRGGLGAVPRSLQSHVAFQMPV